MEELKRDYTMSNPDLCQLVTNMVSFMSRDAAEFLSRGVTALIITDYENMGNAFEVFPSDEEYRGLITIEVDAKEVLYDSIVDRIQLISGFVEQKWGIGSGQYNRLGISKLQIMKETAFLFRAREVVRITTEYLVDLMPIGLTQAMLDALDADAQSFEDKMAAVSDAKALRDEKTNERAEKGNELYGFAVNYANIGKLIWENVNEAKYNDYVIYPTTTQMPGKVLNMGYDLPTRTVSWDAAPYAEDYQMERKYSSDPDWTVVYEGADTSVVNDPVTAGTWYYRCRGQNENGYGNWSNELTVIMPT